MKQKILIIALIGFLTISYNSLMAQERSDRKPKREHVETLTDKQIATVNKILTDYDSESLSAGDAKAIMDAIRDAKVPGGKGVEKAINAAGFSFEKIKKLAPPPARQKGRRTRE